MADFGVCETGIEVMRLTSLIIGSLSVNTVACTPLPKAPKNDKTTSTTCEKPNNCEDFAGNSYPIEQLNIGQAVIHCRYGKGTITAIGALNPIVQVSFDSGSEKWFYWTGSPFRVTLP